MKPTLRAGTLVVIGLAIAALRCAPIQRDGTYAFTAEEIVKDECGFLAHPDDLWDGTLRVDGELFRMQTELFGMELVGRALEVGDGFYLDGTAFNISAPVGGQICQFDHVAVSIRADSESPTAFTGVFRADYLTEREDRCQCELWVRFRATRVE